MLTKSVRRGLGVILLLVGSCASALASDGMALSAEPLPSPHIPWDSWDGVDYDELRRLASQQLLKATSSADRARANETLAIALALQGDSRGSAGAWVNARHAWSDVGDPTRELMALLGAALGAASEENYGFSESSLRAIALGRSTNVPTDDAVYLLNASGVAAGYSHLTGIAQHMFAAASIRATSLPKADPRRALPSFNSLIVPNERWSASTPESELTDHAWSIIAASNPSDQLRSIAVSSLAMVERTRGQRKWIDELTEIRTAGRTDDTDFARGINQPAYLSVASRDSGFVARVNPSASFTPNSSSLPAESARVYAELLLEASGRWERRRASMPPDFSEVVDELASGETTMNEVLSGAAQKIDMDSLMAGLVDRDDVVALLGNEDSPFREDIMERAGKQIREMQARMTTLQSPSTPCSELIEKYGGPLPDNLMANALRFLPARTELEENSEALSYLSYKIYDSVRRDPSETDQEILGEALRDAAQDNVVSRRIASFADDPDFIEFILDMREIYSDFASARSRSSLTSRTTTNSSESRRCRGTFNGVDRALIERGFTCDEIQGALGGISIGGAEPFTTNEREQAVQCFVKSVSQANQASNSRLLTADSIAHLSAGIGELGTAQAQAFEGILGLEKLASEGDWTSVWNAVETTRSASIFGAMDRRSALRSGGQLRQRLIERYQNQGRTAVGSFRIYEVRSSLDRRTRVGVKPEALVASMRSLWDAEISQRRGGDEDPIDLPPSAERPFESVRCAALGSSLPDGALLVAFAEEEDRAFVVAVSSGDDNGCKANGALIDQDEYRAVMRQLRGFRTLLTTDNAPMAEVRKAGSDLFMRLFPEPLATRIRRADQLLVQPIGQFADLAVHLLVDQDRFLFEDRHVVYIASLTHSQLLTKRTSARGSKALIVGDPDLGEKALVLSDEEVAPPSNLIAAGSELKRIAAIYDTAPIAGSEATEEAVRRAAADSGVLHIATHGFFPSAKGIGPYQAGLWLTPRSDEAAHDGLLQAWEVLADLSLPRSTVVLSACQVSRSFTQGGRSFGTLGELGLAFLFAGADDVIATQWRIDDAGATPLFSEVFHQSLSSGNDVRDALQRAIQAVRSRPEYEHPYYWGAFRHIGGARP